MRVIHWFLLFFAFGHYKYSVYVFLSAADAFIYLWDLRDARRPKAALQAVAGASKVDKMLQLISVVEP